MNFVTRYAESPSLPPSLPWPDSLTPPNGVSGVDTAIEAVGVPQTFELCTELIRAGGRVANVGVHGCSVTLHLEKLWIRNVLITTGLVDTFTTPRLLQLVEGGQLDPTPFVTHRFQLEDTMEAYNVFADATKTQALKVVLSGLPVEPMQEKAETSAAAHAALRGVGGAVAPVPSMGANRSQSCRPGVRITCDRPDGKTDSCTGSGSWAWWRPSAGLCSHQSGDVSSRVDSPREV